MARWVVYRFYTIESWMGHTTYEDHQEPVQTFYKKASAKKLTDELNEKANKADREYFLFREEGEWLK